MVIGALGRLPWRDDPDLGWQHVSRLGVPDEDWPGLSVVLVTMAGLDAFLKEVGVCWAGDTCGGRQPATWSGNSSRWAAQWPGG